MSFPASVAETIIDNTQKPVFWKNTARRYMDVNRSFLSFFGLADKSAVLGKTSEEAGLVAAPEKCCESDLRALDGSRVTDEVQTCLSHGEERRVVVNKSPIYEDGRITGLYGTFTDVTLETRQRREIEKLNAELKLHVADFSILMDSTRVSIVKMRLDYDLSITWANDAMFRGIGWTKEEYKERFAYKMRAYFRGSEAELAKLEDAMNRALASGEQRFEVFLRAPSKDGGIWIKGVGTFTDYQDGRPSSLFGVYTDVTDVVETQRKLERAELLASENGLLQQLIDNVPTGISVFKCKPGEPGLLRANHYLSDHFGLPVEIAGVKTRGQLLDYVHPDDLKHCRVDMDLLFEQGMPLENLCRFFDPRSGRYVWTIVRGTIVRAADGTDTAYFSYTNIDSLKKTEAELRENRRIYAKAVETAKLVIWQYDIKNHRVIMSDDQFTKYDYAKFGLQRISENVPQSMVPYIEDGDLPAFLEMYRQVELGHDASCEVWYKHVQGQEPRCMRISYSVELDEQGRPARAIGMGQNITAEKKAEERYQRETEAMKNNKDYGMIAKGHDNLTKNIVIIDVPMSPKAYVTAPGTSYDESCRIIIDGACVTEEDRRAVAAATSREGLLRRYQQGETHTSVRYRRRSADGSFSWALMEMNTFMMPDTGDVACFSYTYDVTEKVLNEEVMSLVADAVFDYIGIIYADSGTFEYLKKSPKIKFPEIRTKTSYKECHDYVRANFVREDELEQFDSATSLAEILPSLEKNGRHSATYMRTEEGRLFCKQLDYAWLDRDARHILVMRTDVTASWERDQKQLHAIEAAKLEADKANEAKSSFLASMSHDLRTPLNGVLGFTEVALRETDPALRQNYLSKIQSSGRLLLDLVNDTLELSRIESGKMTLTPRAVAGREFWESIVTSLRPSAELKNITIDTDPSKYPDKIIWVDRLKVQKVVLNLLSNAIKYTPDGGRVCFSVEELSPPADGCTRRIVVADTGIGMSPSFLTRLYEPFSQERRPEAANVAGTGLGLSIVKKIVDLMGGSIKVRSELNIGTSFTVDLPVPCEEAAQAAQEQAGGPQTPLAGKRVLLCEDNYLNREIAELLLKDQGIEVDCADDGKEGLNKFAGSVSGCYDAILMDLRMPVMDGYKATTAIRALGRPDAATVPIIAMTADAFEDDFHRTKEAGMNGHVTKPIDPEKLMRTLRENIKQKSK